MDKLFMYRYIYVIKIWWPTDRAKRSKSVNFSRHENIRFPVCCLTRICFTGNVQQITTKKQNCPKPVNQRNKDISSAWGWTSGEFLRKDFVMPVLLGSHALLSLWWWYGKAVSATTAPAAAKEGPSRLPHLTWMSHGKWMPQIYANLPCFIMEVPKLLDFIGNWTLDKELTN